MDVDVVIAGAGPVGLMLACELRLGGARALVLERQGGFDTRLRAPGITLRTIEALNRRGLLERLVELARERAEGLDAHFSAIEEKLRQASSPANGALAPVPDMLPIREGVVERVLHERALALGVEVRFEHEVIGLRQDPDGVTVDVRGPDGVATSVRAAYAVGCDGGRSAVRKLADIDFPGTGPTFTGYQAVVTVKEPEKLPRGWHRTPAGVMAYELGPSRVVTIEFNGPPADRNAPVTLDEVQASLRRTSGVDVTLAEPRSLTRFTDNCRLAQTYRLGRVLLAGDAAHVHTPFGGQGLNLGVQDAVNLGWKLSATVRGWAPPGLLDTYHTERHPVAAQVLRNSRATVALLDPAERITPLFELVFRELMGLGEVKRYMHEKFSMVHVRYDMGVPEAKAPPLLGRAAPDVWLQTSGGPARLACLQRTGRGVLLDLAEGAELREVAAGWAGRVDLVRARCEAPDLPAALLIRPDGYTAWVCPRDGEPKPGPLDESLARWFGAGRR
ncbi:FAD-dependent oxidoreductase [Sorangium cellulosum]|uniref:FAD-dependent oxidoreductase n=1 Tax=Sorangium cellulosum TaxID=56 RepID=A0A2L0F4P6_SORCE|nr:FAD-dependent monooxygenase [Sorangium cellulosum]AUX46568.1 FAD-dependent oxidoreductase [Sorangium cellulosum]